MILLKTSMREIYSIVLKELFLKTQRKINNIAQENINFYTHKIPHKILQLSFYSQKKNINLTNLHYSFRRNYFEFKISYPYYVN